MLQIPEKPSLVLPPIGGIKTRHSSAALSEARKLVSEFTIDTLGKRHSVSGITIDSLHSRDLDDGIWCERKKDGKGYLLRVSIASPTEIIPFGGAIETDAFQRATSVYFGENHIYHMLPNSISTGLASLNHETHRPTLTLELEINESFEVERCDMYPSTFYNQDRLDPERFIHDIENVGSQYHDTSLLMSELAAGLHERRKPNIGEFDDAERSISTGGFLKMRDFIVPRSPSFVIQEFMILANMYACKFSVQEGVNGILRSHMPEYFGRKDLPKVLERAQYGGEALGHTGLGVADYSHFTSPIRRLADYVFHRQLIAHLKGEDPYYTREEIEQICQHINLQVISITTDQKKRTYNDNGVRLVRKVKRGDSSTRPLMAHIEKAGERGLLIAPSVREHILQKLSNEDGGGDEWIIRNFFLRDDEKEIQDAIIEKISSDRRTKRYISMLGSIPGIEIEEKREHIGGKFSFTYRVTLDGELLYEGKKEGSREISEVFQKIAFSILSIISKLPVGVSLSFENPERKKETLVVQARREILEALCKYAKQRREQGEEEEETNYTYHI